MTRFKVVWSTLAKKQLAHLWLSAQDRQAITRAQHQIDQFLARDPRLSPGAEISEGLWKIMIPPLAAFYEINDDENLVQVTGLGLVA